MTTPKPITRSAPAKINLTLHVTGQRDDGYHLLDSLVTFASFGDSVTCAASNDLSLRVTGPFADQVPTDTNLVLDAARAMGVTADITLDKRLPVASGVGGGSADAAATLHALAALYNIPLPPVAAQLNLGADVPICVQGGLLRMSGIGDGIEVLDASPPSIPMVLVNPNIAVSTPQVFSALSTRDNAPMNGPIPNWTHDGFLPWLSAQRNDLEQPAISLVPEISDVLNALKTTGGFARMSGSGATCFALYPDERQAEAAVRSLRQTHPNWWNVLAVT